MKGLITYKGKYGATGQYAAWLSELLQLPVIQPEALTVTQVQTADYLVVGTSIYTGKFRIREWLKEHAAVLRQKKIYLFVVNATNPKETEKLNKFIQDNVPEVMRQCCEIFFLPGRIIHKQLSLGDKLLLRVAVMPERS